MIALNRSAANAGAELGVRSATDITGFGLGGHAWEMAKGSQVTIELQLQTLPIIAGSEALAERGHHTRASKTNREYIAEGLRMKSHLDSLRLEFIFDAQTSGGLLLAVPAKNADSAESVLRKHGTLVAARVGLVHEKQPGVDLILAP
jgi:selenide,water dikinase